MLGGIEGQGSRQIGSCGRGIAPGLDRTVMQLARNENIRDVIPFPKIAGGLDPLTGAPAPVDERQLRDLGISVRSGGGKG